MDLLKFIADKAPILVVIPIWFVAEAIKVLVRRVAKDFSKRPIVDWTICYASPLILGMIFQMFLKGFSISVALEGFLVGGFAGWTYPLVKKYIKKLTRSK